MTTMCHIDIEAGKITYTTVPAPKVADEYHAPNAKQYFEKRGVKKPQPIPVTGWYFTKMYITHGNQENGQAVAWV